MNFLSPSTSPYLRALRLMVVTLLLATSGASAQVQWRRIGFGLGDEAIHALVLTDRGTPFAATAAGVIRIDTATMTGAIVWPVAANALYSLSDGSMFSVGDGISRSSDDGATWSQLSDTPVEGFVIITDSGVLYRLLRSKLSRSLDTARSWQLLDTADTAHTSSIVALRDRSILAASSFGLRRSTDDGATWSLVSSASVDAMLETPTGALVGQIAGYAARSTDVGASWSTGARLSFSSIVASEDGTLYGIERSAYEWNVRGTYRSTDDGRNWLRMMSPLPDRLAPGSKGSIWWTQGNRMFHYDGTLRPHRRVVFEPHEYRGPVTDVAVDPEGALYAATPSFVQRGWSESVWHSALSRSVDNGGSWTSIGDSIDGNILAPYGGTVLAQRSSLSVYDRDDRVFRLMARLAHPWQQWSTVASSPIAVSWRPNGLMAVASLDADDFEGYTSPSPLMLSADSGRTWQAADTLDQWRGVLITRSGTIVAGAMASGSAFRIDAAHLRSTDRGATWTRSIDSVVFTDLSEGINGTLFAIGCTVYTGDRGARVMGYATIYRSTDDGLTWTSQLDSVGFPFRTSGFVHTRAGTVLAHADFRFFRSSDNGATWSDISIGEYRHPHTIHVDSTDALLIASGNMIHRSTDEGITWSVLSDGVPSGTHSKLVVASDGALIVATSDDGLWRSDGPASIGERSDAAHRGALSITPNPLRTRGSITLALDKSMTLQVSLYDALGNRVASVFDGRLDAGTHVLQLDVAVLVAGAYLLHVRDDDGSQSRLVIVE